MAKQEGQTGSSTLEKTKKETKEPERFKVILHNDDFTTMEFVIEILVKIFGKDVVAATKIMRDVHKKGSGVAAIYSYDIARTKVQEVHSSAKANGFPLKCTIEKA